MSLLMMIDLAVEYFVTGHPTGQSYPLWYTVFTWAAGLVMFGFVGAILSIPAVAIFGPIAVTGIRLWGGGRWRNLLIGLIVSIIGGAVVWYLLYIPPIPGDAFASVLAEISFVVAPVYGVVLSEVVTRNLPSA